MYQPGEYQLFPFKRAALRNGALLDRNGGQNLQRPAGWDYENGGHVAGVLMLCIPKVRREGAHGPSNDANPHTAIVAVAANRPGNGGGELPDDLFEQAVQWASMLAALPDVADARLPFLNPAQSHAQGQRAAGNKWDRDFLLVQQLLPAAAAGENAARLLLNQYVRAGMMPFSDYEWFDDRVQMPGGTAADERKRIAARWAKEALTRRLVRMCGESGADPRPAWQQPYSGMWALQLFVAAIGEDARAPTLPDTTDNCTAVLLRVLK